MAASYGLGLKRPSAIPGFGLALGFTLTYLSLIVLIPLSALVLKSATLGLAGFWEVVTGPRTLAALRLSFLTSLFAATVNAVFGTIIAWALVRYRFPGRRLLDAFVDLPFALPTAVAGIALTALYAPNGWIGQWLAPLGIKVAYTPTGIAVALIFIGLPFVVRTVQPVLEEFDRELEEASATLGANRRQTVFRDAADAVAGDPDRLCSSARPRRRRIRLGDLHCRQHAVHFRDRAAAHHHQAGRVQLSASGGHRYGDADDLLRPLVLRSSRAGLAAAEIRP